MTPEQKRHLYNRLIQAYLPEDHEMQVYVMNLQAKADETLRLTQLLEKAKAHILDNKRDWNTISPSGKHPVFRLMAMLDMEFPEPQNVADIRTFTR